MSKEAEKENIQAEETARATEFDEQELQEVEEVGEAEALAEGESEALNLENEGNSYIRQMMEQNFIEYASYVIKERAIPDVDDGLKPVQRRILWSLFRMHDGKFHKVANVIGHSMQYHPHGDASIGGALVVLANKEYFIDRQGNFGNIFTGDVASAARYIECRLSPLGLEVLFNNDITEFIDSYDGRNREPVVLPVKIPSLLMLGTEGIAVGMSTRILPHNFCELLDAQISVLRGEDFELYPDFLQGGSMDVSEYENGNGKIKLRAKIERDGRKLIIREIPAVTTTETLIASIERAVEKNKIKVASINDYTAEKVEIEIVPTRGQDPAKMLKALYTYTDCSVSVSCNMMVICDGLPVQMDVNSVIRRNTEKLLEYLRRELEIELARLEELFHSKTLAQIFIENRIYKRIEECESFEKVMAAVYEGLEPFRDKLKRDVNDEDIQKLLAIPIRRISLFDILKNQKELEDILRQIEEVNKNLGRLKKYAIDYLKDLLKKYGEMFPRRTEIEQFKKIDPRAVALNNIKVGWDRKDCYVGTNVKSDDVVTCNEFDHLLCIERKGNYKVINIPDKIFIDRLYDFRKFDDQLEFGVIYRENKSSKYYVKRTVIDKFIVDKTYRLCPKGCRLELLTPRSDSIYTIVEETKRGTKSTEINLKEYPVRSPKARGLLLSSSPITKITHLRYLTEEELAAYEDAGAELKEMESPEFEEQFDDNVRTEVEPETVFEAADTPDEKTEPEPEKENGKKSGKKKIAGKPHTQSDPGSRPEERAQAETEEDLEKASGPDRKSGTKPRKVKETKAAGQPVTERKEKASEPEKKNGKAAGEEPDKPAKSKPRKKAEIKATPETEKPEAEKDSEKETAPETEEKPRTKKPESEKAPEAEPEVEKKPSEEGSKPKTEKKDSGNDNEWGIIQPEFGF
ncbi:MAG: DNA topoisomerase IV subunit A [Victivallaceae bacterium]|nr:DNA topoisomerase IV subunit A [Victivallaceae bacterium]